MAALPYSSRRTGGGAGGHCLQDLKVERGGGMAALPYSSRLTGGRCRGPLPARFKGGEGGGGMAALPYSSRLTGGTCRGPLPARFKGGEGGWLRYRIAHVSQGGGAGGHCLQDLKVERGDGCATV